MWLENIKENKLIIATLAIIGGIFYVMNVWTPLYLDDWHYCFIYGTKHPIQSISDILVSQYHHYFDYNGRFIPHFIIQFFDGIIGKAGFNIVNTGMFLLLIYLLTVTVTTEKKQYYKLFTATILLLFLLLPGFNECFLWMSGACNYFWTGTFILLFHLLLQQDIHSKVAYPFLFCFGIICGWTHEALVIGLSAGYLIYYTRHWNKLKTSQFILLTGWGIGVLFLLLSPANINKAINNIETKQSFWFTLFALKNLRLFFILIIAISIGWLSRYKSVIKIFLYNNSIWFIATLVSIAFIIFARTGYPRSYFGIEFFSLILLLKLITNINLNDFHCIILNSILCLFLIHPLQISFNNYKDYTQIVEQLKTDNKTQIVKTNFTPTNSYYNRFFIYMLVDIQFVKPFDKDDWEIRLIASYFNKKSVIFLPSFFLDHLKQHQADYEEFHTNKKLPFYAKYLSKDTDIKKVTFLLRETKKEEIPFYHRPFANRLARYSATEIETDKYGVVEIEGNSYLLVVKNPMIDHRVKDIRIN